MTACSTLGSLDAELALPEPDPDPMLEPDEVLPDPDPIVEPELEPEPVEPDPELIDPVLPDPEPDPTLEPKDVLGDAELDPDPMLEPDEVLPEPDPVVEPELEPEPMDPALPEPDPVLPEPGIDGDADGDDWSETPAARIANRLQRSKSAPLSDPPAAKAAAGSISAATAAVAERTLIFMLYLRLLRLVSNGSGATVMPRSCPCVLASRVQGEVAAQ